MAGGDLVPEDPAVLDTAWDFGRYLAKRVRARRTQQAVVNTITKALRAGAALEPLTVQRVSGLENLKTGTLPTGPELHAYLVGCGALEQLAVLEAVRQRLFQEYADAEKRRVDGGRQTAAESTSAVPVALAGLPGEEGFTGREREVRLLAGFLAPDSAAGADPAGGSGGGTGDGTGDGTGTEGGAGAGGVATGATPAPAVAVLAGLAGVGKTALALHAAHQATAAGWFPGGVLFVNLHGYDPAGGVDAHTALSALLGALGVARGHVPPTQGEREALFRSTLAALAGEGRRVLLVVDNASHVDQVRPLRPGHPAHRMLVTSRHTLPVPGARRVELDVLAAADAVAVLAQALAAADPADDRIAAEPAEAAELARLCGRLPLAVRITAELLADRPRRPVGDLVRLYAGARDRLAELAYDDAIGVRLAFDASYRHLPADQARLFRLAALHPGPHVGTEALQALAGVPADTARRLAEAVRRAHLWQSADGDRDGTSPDLQFHDLVRLYAAQRCAADETAEDRAAATDRLIAHYRELIEAAGSHLDPRVPDAERSARFADHRAALTRMSAERPNLVAVIRLAATTGRDADAQEMALSLRFFYSLSKHWDEWIGTARHGVEAARRRGDTRGLAKSLAAISNAYTEIRDFDEALAAITEALAVHRADGDRLGEARALMNTGNVEYGRRRYDEALDWYRRSVPIFRELDDRHDLGRVLNNIGYLANELGRLDEAADHYEQSLAVFREIGDRLAIGVTLTNLGAVRRSQGLLRPALDRHEESLAVVRDFGDRHHEGRVLANLAAVHLDSADHDRATPLLAEALEICRELGDRHGEGLVLADLGMLHTRTGRTDAALDCYRQALTALAQVHAEPEVARVRAAVAAITAGPDPAGPASGPDPDAGLAPDGAPAPA